MGKSVGESVGLRVGESVGDLVGDVVGLRRTRERGHFESFVNVQTVTK